MKNKIFAITFLGCIFILLSTEEQLQGQSFQSLSSYTITAEAYVSKDLIPPKISHYPIENVSLLTKIAVIYGTAEDDKSLKKVEIYYKKSDEVSYSTYTFNYSQVKKTTFYFQIPQDFITGPFEYKISAYDEFNSTSTVWYYVDSKDLVSKKINSQGGEIVLKDGNPFDGETFIFIPQGALDKEVEISIKEVENTSVPKKNKKPALSEYPLKVYKLEPSGLKFKKQIQIGLLYIDLDNDGKVDTTEEFDENENILSIFWYDGVNWRNLKSFVDKDKNLVLSWVNHFTYFGIFPLGDLTKDDYKPKERIITPNNDGINDVAIFDNIPQGTEIKIFNLRGKLVKKIDSIPYEWDGKDDQGNNLEVGPYIYQFKINEELISGVIIIAR
ncbi:MAG: gliding motility-associated C-terminal domain-containing protein [Endomicrobiia bacterium]